MNVCFYTILLCFYEVFGFPSSENRCKGIEFLTSHQRNFDKKKRNSTF